MKNEIRRKLTSLTLMTIMVAGGMTFAIPGILPDALATHNANLFVSAENSMFENHFAGPMVIEVVVNDPDIIDTDEAKGEPDVTVNGKDLRMVQAVDGKWYAYFAELSQAQRADQRVDDNGQDGFGLDFGVFCDETSLTAFMENEAAGGVIEITDTVGIALPRQLADDAGGVGPVGGTEGEATLPICTEDPDLAGDGVGIDDNVAGDGTPLDNHVVREAKQVNPGVGNVFSGQINIDPDAFPFIQLYNFDVTGNVIIQYNRGGGPQTVTLTFDSVDQFSDMNQR